MRRFNIHYVLSKVWRWTRLLARYVSCRQEQQVECAPRVHRVRTDAFVYCIYSFKGILMEEKTFRDRFNVNHGVTTKKPWCLPSLPCKYGLCVGAAQLLVSVCAGSGSFGSLSHTYYFIIAVFCRGIVGFWYCHKWECFPHTHTKGNCNSTTWYFSHMNTSI